MNKLEDWIIDCASGPFGSNLKVECFVDRGFPIIDGANLKGVVVTDNITKFVTKEKAKSLSRSIAKRHDVIVTISGTLGQIAYIPLDSLYDEYLCSQRQFRVTFDETKVDVEYLVYYFHTVEGQKKILSFANYVGVPALSQPLPNFKRIEVDFPCLETQHRVVQTIKSIDMKIANNNAVCADLDAMAKLLYDYWFVQFDFPDENGKPYKSSGGKMVWNDGLKREIPKGWDVCALNSKISLERGISYSSDNLVGKGIPMINLGCFAIGGGYKDGNLKSYNGDYPETKIIHPYDLILCLTQQTSIDPRKDVIGCSLLVPDVFLSDIVITQDMAKVVCSDELRYFLIQYINASYFHRYITGFASGSNILHLDVNGILRHITVMPPEGILKQYANLVKPMWEKRSECMSENQQLASLRDFLLPLLMNDQVTICAANVEGNAAQVAPLHGRGAQGAKMHRTTPRFPRGGIADQAAREILSARTKSASANMI